MERGKKIQLNNNWNDKQHTYRCRSRRLAIVVWRQSTKGWHKLWRTNLWAAPWKKVTDGAMYLDTSAKENWQTKGGGDIVTDEEYDNFHLKLEWKIAPLGNKRYHVYVHEDSAKYKWPWETGPEMQVLDNNGHSDGKIIKHRAETCMISKHHHLKRWSRQWNGTWLRSNAKMVTWVLSQRHSGAYRYIMDRCLEGFTENEMERTSWFCHL